ncbi:unnamed protein product [Calypogeia fissa]
MDYGTPSSMSRGRSTGGGGRVKSEAREARRFSYALSCPECWSACKLQLEVVLADCAQSHRQCHRQKASPHSPCCLTVQFSSVALADGWW